MWAPQTGKKDKHKKQLVKVLHDDGTKVDIEFLHVQYDDELGPLESLTKN